MNKHNFLKTVGFLDFISFSNFNVLGNNMMLNISCVEYINVDKPSNNDIHHRYLLGINDIFFHFFVNVSIFPFLQEAYGLACEILINIFSS